MVIHLPKEYQIKIKEALIKAGKNEIGGILMGEHINENEFKICDISISNRNGGFAFFNRLVSHAVRVLNKFFTKTKHKYKKYNYLGEWHSHPSFKPIPSEKDLLTMAELISDESVGANFAILLIVKLNRSNQIEASTTVFTPDFKYYPCELSSE